MTLEHHTENQIPLNLLLLRTALSIHKSLHDQLIQLPHNRAKLPILNVLVSARERLQNLYVLSKWATSQSQISDLIDIFAWLREQNTLLSNTIGHLGGLKSALMPARMPQPDITTALQVLSLGAPSLPNYNYENIKLLNEDEINKLMKNLEVELALHMSKEELPPEFKKYQIKNGKVYFNLKGMFNCSLSLSNDKLILVDFNLGFKLHNNILIPACEQLQMAEFNALQNVVSQKLPNLKSLSTFLIDYSSTHKLQLLHKLLIQVRLGLYRNLIHSYDPKEKTIKLNYWNRINPPTIIISMNPLMYSWSLNSEVNMSQQEFLEEEDGSVNIQKLLQKLTQEHIIHDLNYLANNSKEISITNSPPFLTYHLTPTTSVQLSIHPFTGKFYFYHPTPLLNIIAQELNQSATFEVLERLRYRWSLDKLKRIVNASNWKNITNNLYTWTGWTDGCLVIDGGIDVQIKVKVGDWTWPIGTWSVIPNLSNINNQNKLLSPQILDSLESKATELINLLKYLPNYQVDYKIRDSPWGTVMIIRNESWLQIPGVEDAIVIGNGWVRMWDGKEKIMGVEVLKAGV
ncbi:Rgr1 protein [Martiniozyma asiatica (nom. inval.)]|nr:Rgr1 protein [Martiniozyma asiatica]